MTINQRFSFEVAVQSLARVLAQIKPTPWEKVSVLIKRPSIGQIDNRCHQRKYKSSEKKTQEKISKSLQFDRVSYRFRRCIVIVHKKMRLVYFVWIIEHKKRLSRLDCTFLRVDANMKRKLCHIYFD